MKDPALQKLEKFRSLQFGWHYGSGAPISSNVIERAAEIYRTFRLVGFTRNDFFAGASGEVLATAYYRDNYVGVIIEPAGQYSITYENDSSQILYREELDAPEIKREIREISGKIWNTSDSSIQPTMTLQEGGLTTLFLSPQTTAQDYLFSRHNVQKIPA